MVVNGEAIKLGKRGELIILLHGWGASKEKLLPLGESLKKRSWQVLIPDLPGFGKKGPPPKPWRLEDYAQNLLRTIDDYYQGKKVYLLGHSFGGRIVIKLAYLHPERIRGIVLCGSSGISRANILKRIPFFVLAKTGKLFFPKNEILHRLIYKLAREHDYERTKGIMRETFKLIINEDLKPYLKKIKIPTLILWGKMDKMTRYSDAKIINSEVKHSELISFPGLGHQLPYEKSEKLAEEITRWRDTR